MFLADMPDVIRMEFRDALEDAGVEMRYNLAHIIRPEWSRR